MLCGVVYFLGEDYYIYHVVYFFGLHYYVVYDYTILLFILTENSIGIDLFLLNGNFKKKTQENKLVYLLSKDPRIKVVYLEDGI
jgi:hypothetical protein